MKKIIEKLKKSLSTYVKSPSSRDSLILFSGSLINSALALAAIIFVSRELGPEKFGVLAIFNAVFMTLVGITNLGLDTSAIKIISSSLKTDKKYASAVMRVIFKIELACGLIIAILGILFSEQIALILGGPQLNLAVKLAFIAGAFGSAAAFIGPFFIAYRQFTKNALVGVAGGVVRTVMVIILAMTASLSLNNTLITYTLVPIIFFFVGLIVAPRDWREKSSSSTQKKAAKEIFNFSKWVLLSYVATVIVGKLDVLLISRNLGVTSVGLYTAAQQLASIMPLLIGAISNALLPRFSQHATSGDLRPSFMKALKGSLLLAISLIPVMFLGDEIIHLIFGDKYSGSIRVFEVLFGSYLVAAVGNIVSLVIYAANKPKLLTYLNYITLILAIIIYPIMINHFGMMGAAWTFAILSAFGSAVGIIISYRVVYSK